VRTFILLAALLLFIAGGVYGIFSKDYIQIYVPIFNWFIILTFPLGIYYAFALTSKYDKNTGGGVALGRIAITIFVTMIAFRSIQGYLILCNCNIGRQTEVSVKGKITQLRFPKPKKIFDKNSIDILLSDDLKTITLEVPFDNYYMGQSFEKKLTRGSLDILYGSK